MRDFETPTRSAVFAREAMAATSHPSATLTAVRVLAAGGNAVDAAIAAVAVQCVVEPHMTGIGGDCFALIAPEGSDRVIAYNGSGRTPAGLDPSGAVGSDLDELPRNSPLAITVPGAIDAWTRLHADHGRLPWAEVLAPAIRFAEDGYAVAPRVCRDWTGEAALLAADPAARATFLPDGRAPRIGEVHRQPALGTTLRRIAEQGRDGFYAGPVAEDIVARLQELGGPHALADFSAAQGEYVTPIATDYAGFTVHECPPNGQGVIALMILNILKRFPAKGDPGSADRLHLEIEAARLAYAARDALLADPAQAEVPVERLLSDEAADRLAAMIDPARALVDLPPFDAPAHRDTVYVCVVDRDRTAVSFINSIFDAFGSGVLAPRSGVMLHNRGQSFSLKPGHPNVLAPGKRPLHTIIPGMLTRGGHAVMPFGVMGGHYQAMGHAHLLTRILDDGLDPQQAIDLPRVVPEFGTGRVEAEATLGAEVVAELARRGHEMVAATDPIGGAQAIRIHRAGGVLVGGSESRKDGCALGL
jgi:gamma-glutamyltranspeptidase/glutathione hydrolase